MKTGQLGQMPERRTEEWEPRRDLVVLKHSNIELKKLQLMAEKTQIYNFANGALVQHQEQNEKGEKNDKENERWKISGAMH
eukprot:bmy_03186T0